MITYERSESARENFSKFIYLFQPKTKTLIKKIERILIRLYRRNVSLLFNQACFKKGLLPDDTHTHTHTHTHIYIYIYMYVYIYISFKSVNRFKKNNPNWMLNAYIEILNIYRKNYFFKFICRVKNIINIKKNQKI